MRYPPDFSFEILLRQVLVDNLRVFDETSKQVNNDARFQPFLVQYNSYQQYIRDVISSPDSIPFIDLLVCVELLIKQKMILEEITDKEKGFPVVIGLLGQLKKNLDRPVENIISEQIKKIIDKLAEYEKDIKDFYSSDLKEGLTGLKTSNDRVGTLHRVLIGDAEDLPLIKQYINDARDVLKTKINDLEKHFDKKIEDVVKNFDDQAKEYKKEIIETVCEEIPNRVVGESYYRYNATSQFYPTLVLVFVESTENKYPRRSQLKVKVKKASEEIDENFINNLKREFSILQRKQYRYGPLRACYVSSDKTYKNTIFCSSLDQAAQVFRNVYRIVGLDFDIQNISLTSGRNRKPITRRQRPLDGLVPEVQDYNAEFEVILYRVVLQVNGLPKPILIYKDYRL